MGSAAGKPSESDKTSTWCDPVGKSPAKPRGNPKSTTQNKGKIVLVAPCVCNSSEKCCEKESRNGIAKESSEKDIPATKRWREHRPLEMANSNEQNRSSARVGLDDAKGRSTFSNKNNQINCKQTRKRFEDIPVSRMWLQHENLFTFPNYKENLPPADKKCPLVERIKEETKQENGKRDDTWIDELLATYKEGNQTSSDDDTKSKSDPDQNVKSVGIGGRTILPLDDKPKWDFSTQIVYARPKRCVTNSPPTYLPRTISESQNKPTPLNHQHQLVRNKPEADSKVSPSRYIPRSYSDRVDTTPLTGSRRPSTPFVSGTLSNPRQLNDYMEWRRCTDLGIRDRSSFSSSQDRRRLRTIPDVDEPTRCISPPAQVDRKPRKRDADIPSFFAS